MTKPPNVTTKRHAHWAERGDPERADLERRNAVVEREAAAIERERARLAD